MTELLDRAVLVAATVTSGLLAGLFYAYAVSVMRCLGRTADRSSAAAFGCLVLAPAFNRTS